MHLFIAINLRYHSEDLTEGQHFIEIYICILLIQIFVFSFKYIWCLVLGCTCVEFTSLTKVTLHRCFGFCNWLSLCFMPWIINLFLDRKDLKQHYERQLVYESNIVDITCLVFCAFWGYGDLTCYVFRERNCSSYYYILIPLYINVEWCSYLQLVGMPMQPGLSWETDNESISLWSLMC